MLDKAQEKGVELLLPVDSVVADQFSAEATPEVVTDIPSDRLAMDIGPESVRQYAAKVAEAKTVVWNGPMGVFEFNFAEGTRAVAKAVAGIRRNFNHRRW